MLLYQMHEIGRAWMAPFTYWAEANARIFSAHNTWLGALPGASRVAAGYELMYRLGKDYEKPEFGIHAVEVDGARRAGGQEQVAIDKPFCRLLRFKRFTDDAADARRA